MKKILTFTLVVLLSQMFFVHPTFAGTKEEKFTEKVKTEITKLGTGVEAKVKVKLKDGTKVEGYVTVANQNQFVVMESKTNKAVPVEYSSAKQVKGNNLSTGVKIALAIGITLGVVVLVAFIVGSQLK